MSTELRRVANEEGWTAWENQVVNGVYPLRRFLGASRQSVVFQSEHRARNLTDVAIKFIPAESSRAEALLAQWKVMASVSHPHLIRIFDSGRCQLGGRALLFVVMEYADQTLAQILARRGLSPGEVAELMPPVLDALDFLHQNNLVHGHLKPSNVLAVNDQLKLASDTLRPVRQAASRISRTSLYDPPELSEGNICPAGDIWALGITLVEALTQRTWARGETASLITNLPMPFADTVRRCLSRTPANRPTIAELEAEYRPAPQDGVISIAEAAAADVLDAGEKPSAAGTPQNAGGARIVLLAIAGALLIFLAGWFAVRS